MAASSYTACESFVGLVRIPEAVRLNARIRRNISTPRTPTVTSQLLCISSRHSPPVQRSTVSYRHSSQPVILRWADCYETAHEDGRPQLLIHLSGTLPVVFRGATYNIPLTIWLPHEYPKKPPIVFVTPAKDMLIRPGNHVDPSGRCYHPYLANWVNYSDVCLTALYV